MTISDSPPLRIGLYASLALLFLGADAQAQSNPLTTRMSCGQARSLVAAQGAIVLNTSPLTFDRYVGGTGFCALGEVAEPTWVPTADNAQCPIGYRCGSRNIPARN
jgi:hypothetical protein